MKRNNEYTHGGSVGKNFVLLFRSLFNIASFAVLIWGITMISLPLSTAGAALTAVCLWANLIHPMIVRKRG